MPINANAPANATPRNAASAVRGVANKRSGGWQVRPAANAPLDGDWCYYPHLTKKTARRVAVQWRRGGCPCVVVSPRGETTKY